SDGDAAVDITDVVRALVGEGADDLMIALIRKGPAALEEVRAGVAAGNADARRVDPTELTWQSPVITPSKIVCIALNNSALDPVTLRGPKDHPAFFVKSQNALVGHGQPIPLKREYGLTHPEPELAVVIGRRLKNASPAEALDAIFGYTIMNDVTSVGMREEDTFSFRYFTENPDGGAALACEGHTTYPGRYKGSDGFAPLGPWLVTRDEVGDPDALDIRCWVGDQLVASDNTCNYRWKVADALSHVSRNVTLIPGDVVSMGTAVGGDTDDPMLPDIPGVTKANLIGHQGTVTVEIAGLGRLTNPIVTA
ncbi:MAG: FAA hydrolase family protein, partial [Lysobacteraceae bacterium]